MCCLREGRLRQDSTVAVVRQQRIGYEQEETQKEPEEPNFAGKGQRLLLFGSIWLPAWGQPALNGRHFVV